MSILWTPSAWKDYLYWQATDKKKLKRINELTMKITLDIQDNRFDAFVNFIETLDYVSISSEKEIINLQKDEVNRRLRLLKNGKIKTRSWDEAKKDIFKR